jgi:hypothetical protein
MINEKAFRKIRRAFSFLPHPGSQANHPSPLRGEGAHGVENFILLASPASPFSIFSMEKGGSGLPETG